MDSQQYNGKPEKNKKWSTGKKLILAAVLLLVAAAIQYVYIHFPELTANAAQEVRFTDTKKGVTYDIGVKANFYSYDSRYFYFCTPDGMRYVSVDGELQWQEIFNLTRPEMVAKNETVAVGEARGKHIYVFTPKGLLYDILFENPVLFYSVNQAGYLSVIMQIDKGYDILVYNNKGKQTYKNAVYDADMYPMAVDASEDGRYVAIAIWDLSVRMTARIYFYFMNEYDSWSTQDGLFAMDEFPDQLIYQLRFMDENRALIFTDTQVYCYQPGVGNTLNFCWQIPLYNKIDQLQFYGGKRFAFATGEKRLNQAEAVEPGTIYMYNMAGEKTATFPLGRRATYLSMGCESLIVGADRSYYAINANGTRLWEHVTLQDIRALIFLNNTDTVLVATASQATVMKRVKHKVTTMPEEGTDVEHF